MPRDLGVNLELWQVISLRAMAAPRPIVEAAVLLAAVFATTASADDVNRLEAAVAKETGRVFEVRSLADLNAAQATGTVALLLVGTDLNAASCEDCVGIIGRMKTAAREVAEESVKTSEEKERDQVRQV